MSEWKEYKLGELGKIVTGKTPPTSQHQNYDGDIPFICIPDLGKSRFIFHTNKTISKIGLETVKNCSLPKGSIVVSCIATIGQVGITTKDISVTNQQINSLIPDSNLITEEFCYYYFKNLGEDLAQFGGGGSIFEIISKDKFSKVYLTIPSLPEQTAIASVLSSLDDKIDLLHRQNATLEKMAETLFRQWFVERRPEPVEGEAKEDWKSKPLSSIAVFLNGLACQKFPPKNNIEKLPVLKIKELSSGITENSDWATTDVKPEYIVKNGDVIFAWSASLMVKIWDGQDCILNQHLFKVTSKDYPKWFYFLWCKHHLDEFIAKAASHATTMGHIKRGDLDKAMVLIPSTKELEEMTLETEPLIEKIIANNKQIKLLVNLRDTLLPKLMSG
ncbi:MAG TPA: restriction endonuclease subunit S, partial [Paludibacteraceae bacterium]|nr:restriction endonuclease subunit S [Paludibacteraceae bacterium]